MGIISVLSISSLCDGRTRVEIRVSSDYGSEDFEFILLDDMISDLGLKRGDISSDTLERIEFCSNVTRAYVSACASFAAAPSSYKGLFRKLITKGYGRDVCSEAIALVELRGFVDETEIAVRKAEIYLDRGWGRLRIIRKLKEDGFPDDAIEDAIYALGDEDFAVRCAEFIKKKYSDLPIERREREKMYATLMRYGYSSEEIRGAIRLLSRDD